MKLVVGSLVGDEEESKYRIINKGGGIVWSGNLRKYNKLLNYISFWDVQKSD